MQTWNINTNLGCTNLDNSCTKPGYGVGWILCLRLNWQITMDWFAINRNDSWHSKATNDNNEFIRAGRNPCLNFINQVLRYFQSGHDYLLFIKTWLQLSHIWNLLSVIKTCKTTILASALKISYDIFRSSSLGTHPPNHMLWLTFRNIYGQQIL